MHDGCETIASEVVLAHKRGNHQHSSSAGEKSSMN
jgi:hypothetical protein